MASKSQEWRMTFLTGGCPHCASSRCWTSVATPPMTMGRGSNPCTPPPKARRCAPSGKFSAMRPSPRPWSTRSVALPRSTWRKAGARRVSGSSETKTYGKDTAVRERKEKRTLPRRSIFGKDIDKRARIFNVLHVLFSSPEGLFSGEMSGTAIAGRW